MKQNFLRVGMVFVSFAVILLASNLLKLPVPYYQDFSVMYFAQKSLLHGIPLYAYPQQLEFIKSFTPAGFHYYPYPYPPWYAILTLYIGLLPVQVAARFWFLMNTLMIFLSGWVLVRGANGNVLYTLPAALLALLFVPSLGLLVVGQYSVPLLLGVSLFLQGAGQKKPLMLAVSLLLMTFKPHIGALLFLAGFFWLVFEGSAYSRKALLFTLAGGLLLAGAGFLADSAWPLTYLQSVARYQNIEGVQSCNICANPVVIIFRWLAGHASLGVAAIVGLVLALLAGVLLFKYHANNLANPFFLMSLASIFTLLLVPYSLNYDYILLLVPILLLARFNRLVWVVYAIPFGVLFWGRDANILLPAAGGVLLVMVLRHSIDLGRLWAYNLINN